MLLIISTGRASRLLGHCVWGDVVFVVVFVIEVGRYVLVMVGVAAAVAVAVVGVRELA
jgi:hypothetical protein